MENKKMVGIRNNSFNKKVIELHKLDEQILAKFGLNTEIEDEICFNCGAEKLNFFYSKNVRETEEERGYLKCKCFSCNFSGDVIDIARKLDPDLKNKKTGEIVDYLLSKEFQDKPNIVDINREYKTVKKIRKKKKEENIYKSYYIINNTFIVNFKKNRPREITEYLYSRGFNDNDFQYMYGFLGYENFINNETGVEYKNLIFPCSDFSFIRRFTREYYKKDSTKITRYMNSKNLERTKHHCYLLEMIKTRRIVQNNFYNIYICEGVFDALSVRVALKNQCLAFATGGATSTQDLIASRLTEVAEEVYNLTHKKINVILLFDSDKIGKTGQEHLASLLEKNTKINVLKGLTSSILNGSKDINEEFIKDRERLTINLLIIEKNLK